VLSGKERKLSSLLLWYAGGKAEVVSGADGDPGAIVTAAGTRTLVAMGRKTWGKGAWKLGVRARED